MTEHFQVTGTRVALALHQPAVGHVGAAQGIYRPPVAHHCHALLSSHCQHLCDHKAGQPRHNYTQVAVVS